MAGTLAFGSLIHGSLAEDSKPNHSVGSGADDWWTTYPAHHSSSGSEVDHPQWVLDSLKEKPVLILDHSKDCLPCKDQMKYMAEILQDFGGSLTYYDLLADEQNSRTDDVFSAYNPTGGEDFVPLTAIVTLVRGPDGTVQVGWHSVDDATSEDWIRSYVSDAIHYHGQNSADWKK